MTIATPVLPHLLLLSSVLPSQLHAPFLSKPTKFHHYCPCACGCGSSPGQGKPESQKNNSPSTSSYHLATVPSLGAAPGGHLHRG